MLTTSKMAASLPKENFKKIEKARKKPGIRRSTLIKMVIRFWLDRREKQQMIKQYEEGYRQKPKTTDEIIAMEDWV